MAKYKLKRHYEPDKIRGKELEKVSESQWWAIEKVAAYLEHSRLNDYVALIERPGRWMWVNFVAGVTRGVGIAVGFTLLGAVAVIVLQQIVTLNLPGISDFIADILDMVEQSRSLRP